MSAAILANLLTLLRLVLGLAFPWIPHEARLAVVVIAGVSDFVDGAWSRWWGATTQIGKVLDPIADKVFVLAVLGTFLWEGRLLPWQVSLLIARDVSVTIGGLWFAARQREKVSELKPRIASKIATAAQFTLLISLLVLPGLNPILFWATVGLTLIAAVDYGWHLIGRLR